MPAHALLAPPTKTAAPAKTAAKTAVKTAAKTTARPVVATRTVARPTVAAPLAQRQLSPALAGKVPAPAPKKQAPNALAATAEQLLGQLPDIVREKAAAAAHDFKGYPLLTVLLGYDPFAHRVVKRTPHNLVHGILALTPNGEQQLKDLEQSGALPQAFDWLRAEAERHHLSVRRVQDLLAAAWRDFHWEDAVLHPINTATRLVAPFEQLGLDLVDFGKKAFARVLEFVFTAVLGDGARTVLRILRKAGDTYRLILRNPLRFAGYLVKAGKEGFDLFYAHLGQHLKKGLTNWLMGSLQGSNLVLPERFDGPGLLSLALQALGLSYSYVRGKVVDRVGEPAVHRLEQAAHLGKTLLTKGLGAAAQEMGGLLSEFTDTALGSLREWVTTTVVGKAVTKLASLLLPAAALLEAVHSTYTTVMFFLERARQLGEVVTAFLDSVATIAAGKTTDAAKKVEGVMSGLVPLIIGFLASLVGLDKLSGAIQNLLKKLRKPVDLLINKLVDFVLKMGKKALGAAQQAGQQVAGVVMGWFGTRQKFTQPNGETHTLFFKGTPERATLMMASKETELLVHLRKEEGLLPPGDTSDRGKNVRKALGLAVELQGFVLTNATALRQKGGDAVLKIEELSRVMALISGVNPDAMPLPPAAVRGYKRGQKTSDIYFLSTASSGGQADLDEAPSPNGWELLKAKGFTRNSSPQIWVRMHLVSQKLGGEPKADNLVPAPSRQNTGDVLAFETKLKDLVEAKDKKGNDRYNPAVVWLETGVTAFHDDQPTIDEVGETYEGLTNSQKPLFAREVHFAAGLHYYDGQQAVPGKARSAWPRNTAPQFELTVRIERPNFDPAFTWKPNINDVGAQTIHDYSNCSLRFATFLKRVQRTDGDGNFQRFSDLKDRLTTARALPENKDDVSNFTTDLELVRQAIEGGQKIITNRQPQRKRRVSSSSPPPKVRVRAPMGEMEIIP